MHPLILAAMREDPVVITGAGAVSVAGCGADALWQAAREGRPGARTLSLPWQDGVLTFPGCPVTLGAEAADAARSGHRLDPSVRYALAAAREAASQAGLTPDTLPPGRLGVAVGTSRGCRVQWEEAQAALESGRRVRPTMAARTTLACLSGAVAHALGARGPGLTLSATCASGAAAIAQAAEQLVLGNADVMLAGGAEAVMSPAVFLGMQAAGVLGTHPDPARACRPFDRSRNGLVLGEGAGFLVLERASHAAARGAAPLARLDGWTLTVHDDAGKAGVSGDGEGMAEAIAGALTMAGRAPEEIGYVNAHGTGTVLNDRAEAAAVHRIFGANPPPLSSTKPVTGHCLGATPAMEAVLALHVLRTGFLPPTATCQEPDPALAPFDPLPGTGRQTSGVQAVLSNSLGFWGCHAALVFSRPRPGPA